MSSEDDAELEELRRKREERKRLQEEEERRENEERQRREDERNKRKLERERKAKEREDAHTKELEERKGREQKEEERKRRREEREKQKQEEERLEREAEEKRAKEREDKRKQDAEREEEERKKQKEKEQEALKKQQEDFPARDTGDSLRPGSRRKQKLDRMMNLIQLGQADALDKIVVDDDMKEEALKLLTENNDMVCDFFNKPETILTILRYISTVLLEPEKKSDDELEDIMGRMDFAKEAISGNIPSLWRTILQPENRQYLEELFSILKNDTPTLPPINITSFWKSVEFLLYRRSYEISNFMLTNREIVPNFIKHVRDTKVMDVLFKLVDKETTSTPLFKDYDPKKAATLPEEETRVWTDYIPDAILAFIGKLGRGEDTEWSDIEVENAAQFTTLVLEKFPECKLAHQFRDASFCNRLISRVFTPVSEPGRAGFRYQSTLVGLLSFVVQLLKFYANTSAYTTDTIPALVSFLIYGPGGKGSRSDFVPANIMKTWLVNHTPEFEHPIEQLTPSKRSNTRSIGVMRVKCIQLFKALVNLNFQSVDAALRDNGTLLACVDLFFQNVDNNIMHNLVEDIVKTYLTREATAPITDILEATPTPITSSLSSSSSISLSQSFSSSNLQAAPFTQYLLEECSLVERLVTTLRAMTLNKNVYSGFAPTKLDFEEPAAQPEKPTSARNGKKHATPNPIPDRDKPFLPPAYVGHVLNICKAITQASEKSVKLRHIVASCSGYHWGQTVMFHLGMRDSADMEWKKPFKKVDPQDVAAAKDGERTVD